MWQMGSPIRGKVRAHYRISILGSAGLTLAAISCLLDEGWRLGASAFLQSKVPIIFHLKQNTLNNFPLVLPILVV